MYQSFTAMRIVHEQMVREELERKQARREENAEIPPFRENAGCGERQPLAGREALSKGSPGRMKTPLIWILRIGKTYSDE